MHVAQCECCTGCHPAGGQHFEGKSGAVLGNSHRIQCRSVDGCGSDAIKTGRRDFWRALSEFAGQHGQSLLGLGVAQRSFGKAPGTVSGNIDPCQGSGQSVAVLHHERSALGRSRGKVRQRQRALAGTHRSFRFGSARQSRHRARGKRTYERTRAYAGHQSAETSQGGACLHGNLH